MSDSTKVPESGSDRRPLDALDRSIIETLQTDCQTSNRALARQLGVTEATVAARVHALVDARYIRFALQRSLYTLGYRTLFFVELTIRGRSIDEVCGDLHEIPEVVVVSVVAGVPQIVVVARARNDGEVAQISRHRLRIIAGVQRAEISIVLDTLKFASGIADLTDM